MPVLHLSPATDRATLYLRYKVEAGMFEKYGPHWMFEDPRRVPRLERELELIEDLGFPEYFLILAQILDYCRAENIPYGPGRGSMGGCYTMFAIGAHEVDSLEWDLLFERFLTAERVTWPDVDIDLSQRDRPRVIEYMRQAFEDDDHVVLQVAAFARASGRSVIDMMLAAHPEGGATAENLRKCLPEGNITGGTKQPRELGFWLDQGKSGNQARFTELATQADWLDTMLKLDGIQTHLAKHAAGVVILSREDLAKLPLCGSKNATGDWHMMTGYDMYALEDLDYLKYDMLGLRTLDLLADAYRWAGLDDGTNISITRKLMALWQEKKDDPATYDLLSAGDTLGVFQVETSGYRRTLKDFEPREFNHIVYLNALYRPGALDYQREDGKNMVQVFIERRHGRERITYSHGELTDALHPILSETQGIILFQEQAMRIAVVMAGFDGEQADALRKAIGKKKRAAMIAMEAAFLDGCEKNGYSKGAALATWTNIAAAARYSWNKSHCLHGDTPIPTITGIKKVAQIEPGDVIISTGTDGLYEQPVKKVHPNGLQTLYHLRLKNGLDIRATPNHRFLSKDGYKRVDELVVGDALQVSNEFRPAPGVTCLASVMTAMAEGYEIPGWIVLYDAKRDDMMYWQFIPALNEMRLVAKATDAATPTIAFPNLLLESVIPGEDGIEQIDAALAMGLAGAPFLTRQLSRTETNTFFGGSEVGLKGGLNRSGVESEALIYFRTRELIVQIPGIHLIDDRRRELLTPMSSSSMQTEKTTEGSIPATQSKHILDMRIRPAFGVEIENLLSTLPQLIRVFRGESNYMSWNISPRPSASPLSIGSERPTAAAFAAFWERNPGHIVPGLSEIDEIVDGGQSTTYDLEMADDHNFVANGIISHNSVEYGILTFLCAWFKANEPAAYYTAYINSWKDASKGAEKQSEGIAEARQHVEIVPPDLNVAEGDYIVRDGKIVFGLNGIKGMGQANRDEIIGNRSVYGPFTDFADFQRRLPSVPISMKISLIRCGAFDKIDNRSYLLAEIPAKRKEKDGKIKEFLMCEAIKHEQGLKKPRGLPGLDEIIIPSDQQLAEGEKDTIGFYVSTDPMKEVTKTLARLDPSMHWGGTIEYMKIKRDKRGQEFATATLLTNALTKLRLMIWSSVFGRVRGMLEQKGTQLIIRGHMDGSQILVDGIFVAGDYRHFKVLWAKRGDEPEIKEPFDGEKSTIERYESSGYTVKVL